MNHLAFALHLAIDTHELRAEHLAPLPFEDMRMHHDIDITGLIFERDEDDAGGGLRALPAGNDTGRSNQTPVGHGAYFGGARQSQGTQLFAQQRQRMTAQSEAETGIVGHDVLAFARRHQDRFDFTYGCLRQRIGVGSDGFPLPRSVQFHKCTSLVQI